MPDVTDQLRRYAEHAAGTVEEVDLARVQRPRSARPRARRFVAVAAALLLAAGAAFALLDRSDDPDVVTNDPTTTSVAVTTTTADATTTTIGEQSTHRTFPVIAVTDNEYLVWSGEAGSDAALRSDGFAYDVASGSVRAIPPAPIAARSGATGVWTGSELIVCCGTGRADGYGSDTQSAAAWDPASGEWRELARPPESIARSYPTAVWTGSRVVVVAPGPAAAEYDPESDTWREIEPPPIQGRQPTAVWTGDEVIVWDPVYGTATVPPSGGVEDRGWRWTPGDEAWTELPSLPEGSRTRLGSMAWTGGEIVVWGLSTVDDALGVGARWRPGDAGWRPAAASPQGAVPDPYEGTPGSQAITATADGRVLVKGIDGGVAAPDGEPGPPLYLYDPSADRWTTTAVFVDGYHPDLLVVGTQVLVPDRVHPAIGTLPP
jgi:hypothetical protein